MAARELLTAIRQLGGVPGGPWIGAADVMAATGEPVETLEDDLRVPGWERSPRRAVRLYGELMAMAQPWRVRHLLVDHRGHRGGRCSDEPPSDLPYNQFRLSPLGEAVADGIVPDALVTGGAEGVPFNLRELAAFLDGGPAPLPDFPTGGVLLADENARALGRGGAGRLTLRARTRIAGPDIHVSELPWGVPSDVAIDGIVREGGSAIAGLRNEAGGDDVHLVVETRDDARELLARLIARDPLQRLLDVRLEAPLESLLGGVDGGAFRRVAAEHGDARRTDLA